MVVLGLRPDDALPVSGIQNEHVQRILREGVRSTTVYVRLREERDWHTKASSAVPFRVVECEAPSMDVSGTFEGPGGGAYAFARAARFPVSEEPVLEASMIEDDQLLETMVRLCRELEQVSQGQRGRGRKRRLTTAADMEYSAAARRQGRRC